MGGASSKKATKNEYISFYFYDRRGFAALYGPRDPRNGRIRVGMNEIDPGYEGNPSFHVRIDGSMDVHEIRRRISYFFERFKQVQDFRRRQNIEQFELNEITIFIPITSKSSFTETIKAALASPSTETIPEWFSIVPQFPEKLRIRLFFGEPGAFFMSKRQSSEEEFLEMKAAIYQMLERAAEEHILLRIHNNPKRDPWGGFYNYQVSWDITEEDIHLRHDNENDIYHANDFRSDFLDYVFAPVPSADKIYSIRKTGSSEQKKK